MVLRMLIRQIWQHRQRTPITQSVVLHFELGVIALATYMMNTLSCPAFGTI